MNRKIVCQENNYDGKYIYTITYLKADGDTAAAEEAAVTNKVNEVYKSLQLDGKSSYDKLKAIHDYIIDHVEYDYENYKNDAYLVKHATYSAAITGKTVCQGYATYFYRLANKAGIECRVVDGTGNGGGHAWNLVKIDGKYYFVDVTWDDGNYDKYTYFLKESDLFAQDHTLSDESQKNFGDYNISKTDYDAKLIPTHTHNYVTTTKREPTCIDEGLSVKTCTICQDEQMIILPKTTHQWTLHSTVAATEDKDGSKTYTCSVCGETKTEVISRLPKATWMKNQNGWWYQNIDGTYPRKQWMKIDNIWYYFDVDGYVLTDWQKINNKWYFFDDKGAMVTGWKKSGSKWYYLDGQGAMVSDKWQKIDGKWYVFDKSGAMKSNAWVGNYYVGSDGAYVKDRWIGKYHVNKNGVWDKTAGWQKLGGSCYYLGQDGTMKTGWQYISDKCYYFYDSGKMAS
ncbi:transglutaminase domain-containing protein, partial [Sharpea azabuensis]|uniref:transglutaminase domain-containing protein n=1 Tax=Sharpea azabuensis TaxID=322505 RepID=UPI002E80002D